MKELTLKELQTIEIEILKDVHDFCLNNDIKYSLYGGTAIGAVRHGGFIPWDDDIDIVMPRSDYEKFCKIYSSNKYQLIERRQDKNSMIAYARVCDNKRTVCKSKCPWYEKGEQGVFIDVLPADGYDSDDASLYDECRVLRKESLRIRNAILADDSDNSAKLLANKKLWSKAGDIIDRLIEKSMTYKFGEVDSWAVLCWTYPENTVYPLFAFDDVELVKFENDSFFLLKGVDVMLTNAYGDYMQLPPVEKRVPPMGGSDIFYWKTM